MRMYKRCWCCRHWVRWVEAYHVQRIWEGRLDGYCRDCAGARCDAYPGECPREPAA